MSAPRSPIAPNSKPTQLPYGWGLGGEENDEFKIQDSKQFKIPNPESRVPKPEFPMPSPESCVPIPCPDYPFRYPDHACLPLCNSKQKELAIYDQDLKNLHVIENNNVISFPGEWFEVKRRGKI
jgi:hypothetical protein